MIIALDYDGTYTADPVLWDGFIGYAKAAGHTVVMATMRHEPEEPIEHEVDCRVIYTGRQAKRAYLAAFGIAPQIWIDDNPFWIYQDAL